MTFRLAGREPGAADRSVADTTHRPIATRFRRSRDTHPGQPMGTEQARSD